MLSIGHLCAVGAGAALGAIGRWLLGLWLNQPGAAMPWGTLTVNLVGGYAIGLSIAALMLFPTVPDWAKLFITAGFLGGFTTFSTFSAETVGLLERGDYPAALAYAGLSLFGSLALTALGFATVHALR